MKISIPQHLGEQKEVHSQSIGKFAHHRPQTCKRENGYESKGKLQKKKIRSDGATGGPCNTPENSTVSKREPQTLPHLFCEKLFLSSQHAGGLCGNLYHEPRINYDHSVFTKFVSALSS